MSSSFYPEKPLFDTLFRSPVDPLPRLSEKVTVLPNVTLHSDVSSSLNKKSSFQKQLALYWWGLLIIAVFLIGVYVKEKLSTLQQTLDHTQAEIVTLQATVQNQSLQLSHLQHHLRQATAANQKKEA
jgi:hypothetical protein